MIYGLYMGFRQEYAQLLCEDFLIGPIRPEIGCYKLSRAWEGRFDAGNRFKENHLQAVSENAL